MSCEQIERIGLYVDDEMPASERHEFEAHFRSCPECVAGLVDLSKLANSISATDSVHVPDTLWPSIEKRLQKVAQTQKKRRFRLPGGPWAMAALIALAVGLGAIGLSSLESVAHASTVDYAVLLDTLPLNPRQAFRDFVARHDGILIRANEAHQIAPNLSFETPAVLPGGFHLQSVYELRIGRSRGIAAAYNRSGEFLAVVFHPPVKREEFGSYKNFPCVIGEHCGHKIEIGEWKLVHLTDPTTCHCLLSRLDEHSEMPSVLAVIAPKLTEAGTVDDHHRP